MRYLQRQGLIIMISLISLTSIWTQGKKIMDPSVYNEWRKITNTSISADGHWVVYNLEIERGDKTLKLYHTPTDETYTFDRAQQAKIDYESYALYFHINAAEDSIRQMKRKKMKEDDMPKDTLGIFNLRSKKLSKIPNVKSYKIPEKWGGILAVSLEKQGPSKKDTSATEEPPKKKKESKENGTQLLLVDIMNDHIDTLSYVKDYLFADQAHQLLFRTTGVEDNDTSSLILMDLGQGGEQQSIITTHGDFYNMVIDETGDQVAFLLNRDTTEMLIEPYELFYKSKMNDEALMIADSGSSFLGTDWQISKHQTLYFSDDGNRLFFGINEKPILQDTSLLKDEIVEVEVWSHTDDLLYTQQENNLEDDKKKNYLSVYHTDTKETRIIGSAKMPKVVMDRDHNGSYALAYNDTKYLRNISWDGYALKDMYIVDLTTGESELIGTGIHGRPSASPDGSYFYWYSASDTAWYSYSTMLKQINQLTSNSIGTFYNELNDQPAHPRSYSSAGWIEGDEGFLVYDRYDIWKLDPTVVREPKRLTNGRQQKIVHRYVHLDPEDRRISSDDRWLIRLFDERDKSSGYGLYNPEDGTVDERLMDDVSYSARVMQAENSDEILYTKESFSMFPDLQLNTLMFDQEKQVSHANPQQSDYRWGTIELMNWTSYDGQELRGLLVKPDDFDPSKKYPVIVNFYERSSDRLHRHGAPFAGRSTIGYAYYANQGYVIFNPDVPYTEGYPGESCYNAVMSGVDALSKNSWVDISRMALQGHSWGGYQIAHLLTKTDRFRCAEAGAPVVNMISAYGGIRWGSGMSRMFQYEHTQSRIGGTLWEKPELYIENSPIFNTDKVSTPVLILHNDMDGAVPWYQGIEYFMALQRLDKKAWFLNYNNEPHWPLKWQNRLDFNIRLQQFFDHYLKDQPMPSWMIDGVPAIAKGIHQGYEIKE